MEEDGIHCSYDLNQNGSLGNDHIFIDHDNSLHDQMVLLSLPHHHDDPLSTGQAFPSGSRIMETIIVMSDSMSSGQAHINSSNSQIIVVHSNALEEGNLDGNVSSNAIGETQPLRALEVESELAGIDGDHSPKSCEVNTINGLDLNGKICMKIDLNNSPTLVHSSSITKMNPTTDEIELKPYESAHVEESQIRRSLRPRPQKPIVNSKPRAKIVESSAESEYDDTEEEAEDVKLKPTPLPKQKSKSVRTTVESDDEFEDGDSFSEDDDHKEIKKCVVCLRYREFVESIFDDAKQLYHHIETMLAYVHVQVNRFSCNIGICPECFDQLQHWHIFISAITKRHETVASTGEKFINEPVGFEAVKARVYRNFKKMGKVKEVYLAATHSHYARRHLSEKDWDYFCEHLFHANSVKSEKSKELERFLMSREKLSQLYCTKCNKLVPDGKANYTAHMEAEHSENPVLYPCDICGVSFPEKDMTASTEDYYPHWISHFYFNSCEDCAKRFPTKRALGQHRHAVHKNRQVNCDRCGKVLANKMSLDLHLLRHLPDDEKNKYMTKCKICKKRISSHGLRSHLATHNDERPWKCDHCDSTFKMKGALVSHRDVVHFNLKNHVCGICKEAFKSASSLRGHVRRHEGRKDYKCDVCLKEYYTYSALKGHKIVHQTTRDFICEVCGKAFKKKKALEEHVTIHTGLKLHQCPICGREIRVKSNLYKHMKIHNKAPEDTTLSKPIKKRINAKSGSDETTPSGSASLEPKAEHSESNTVNDVQSITTLVLTEPLPDNLQSMNLISESSVANNANGNRVQFAIQSLPQTTAFLPHHFQSNQDGLVQTITMQHQHQDLLNVPLLDVPVSGPFYSETGQQYFVPADPTQT